MIHQALIVAERVARNIIPDLRGVPVYIVQPAAGLMVTREMTGCHMGLFYPGLDRALQPQLEASGRWRGPGVAIVVDAVLLFAMSEHDDNGLRAVVGSVLHELAHWADRPEPAEPSPTPYHDFLTTVERAATPPAEPPRFSPAFLAHGESFIRLCCHLWYRAAHGGGCILRPWHLHFGNDYNGLEMLGAPATYIEALSNELRACKSFPLRTIAEMEPPAEFAALWDDVLERMFLPAHGAA